MVSDALTRFLDVLAADQRGALESLGTQVRFPPRHTLSLEGQPAHAALLIRSGAVKVTITAPNGSELLLAIRGPDELLGEEAVLTGEPREATITTLTEVTAVDIGAAELRRFVADQQLWPMLYGAAVRRRRQADRRTLLAAQDVGVRLATLLLELATRTGQPGGDGIDVPLTQEELGRLIGASRESVAMQLRRLRERNVVTTERRMIRVTDLETLRKMVSGEP